MRVATVLVVATTLLDGAPHWVPQESGTGAEFRGLDAVSAQVAWAAGRGGVVSRTTDGGATWQADSIPGAGDLFLIDVHALNEEVAWVLGTSFNGNAAKLYHSTNGGQSWTTQYARADSGVFFDGFADTDPRHGVAFSDPVGGSLLIIRTEDGVRWTTVDPGSLPPVQEGEAGFAASGTAITALSSGQVWIGTGGGKVARVFRSEDAGRTWDAFPTPLPAGSSSGIFGVAFRDSTHGLAVGGDYRKPNASAGNLIRTTSGGRSWELLEGTGLEGVQYGISHVAGDRYVATGPTGSFYTEDAGSHWTRLSTNGYNTASFAGADGGWAAGTEGSLARFVGE
jgi:photosystem II stability/assembly factor-like uncharacterized protein